MADGHPQMPDSGAGPTANESSTIQGINLRFLAVDGVQITLPNVDLNTKIGALKNRLQQEWPNTPQPDRQRLIYRGRALLNMDAALKSVLGSEVCLGIKLLVLLLTF